MSDPAMTEHLGGPESPEKIRQRNERYSASSEPDQGEMFVITLGYEETAVGSVGYWEKEWQGVLGWETGWSILPEYQGQGIATKAALVIIERARAEQKHRYLHAFPSVDNGASNAICRKAGFSLQREVDFEYPTGSLMRCNDWRLDLFADQSEPIILRNS